MGKKKKTMHSIASHSLFKRLVEIVLVAVGYYLTARLGFSQTQMPGQAPIFWPAAGLALAVVIMRGWQMGFGVMMGAWVSNLDVLGNASIAPISFVVALVPALEAWGGAYILKRFVGILPPPTMKQVLTSIGLMAVIALFASVLGVVGMYSAGYLAASDLVTVSWSWAIGVYVGILVVAPGLIVVAKSWRQQILPESLAWLLASLVIGLAFFTFLQSWHDQDRELNTQLRTDASEISRIIQVRVLDNEQLLLSVRALFGASQKVERDEYSRFVAPLLPRALSIQTVGWAPRVTAEERPAFEEYARRMGLTDFYTYERDANNKSIPVAKRAEYYPCIFFEPFAANLASLGFDLASENTRLQTLLRASETGQSVFTPPLRLVQTTDNQKHVLLMNAVYRQGASLNTAADRRQNTIGIAYLAFPMNRLVEHALAEITPHDIELYLFDVTDSQPQFLAFHPSLSGAQTTPENGIPDPTSLQQSPYYTTSINLYGRHWLFIARPGPAYIDSFRGWDAWSRLLVGLASAGIFLLYMTIRQQTEEKLRVSERRSRVLLQAIPDLMFRMTRNGIIVDYSANDTNKLYAPPSAFIGKNIVTVLPLDVTQQCNRAVEKAFETQSLQTFEYQLEMNGESHCFEARVDSNTLENEATIIVRDITERKESEKIIRQSQANLELAQSLAHLGSWELDPNTGVGSWSQEMFRLFQRNPADGVPVLDEFFQLIDSDDRTTLLNAQARAIETGERITVEYRANPAKIGARFFEATLYSVKDAHGQFYRMAGTVQDLTERKQAEARLHKLNRTYAVLSQVNEAIVRERNPQSLCETACQIAIEQGGFRLAWIELINPQTQVLEPIAQAGDSFYTVEKLGLQLGGIERLNSPTDEALRSGKHLVINDIANDPQTLPWRTTMLELGYHSSAIFPIVTMNQVQGTLNLYAPEVNFFDQAELKLFDEMVQDIGFALEFIEQEEQRKQAEEKLHTSQSHLRERLKELTCLRQVYQLVEQNPSLPILCQQTAEYLVLAMQFPDLTVGVVEIDGHTYSSDEHAKPVCTLNAAIMVNGTVRGQVTTHYTQERPFIIPEEQNLLDSLAQTLGLWLERSSAVEMLAAERNSLARRVDERTADLRQANLELGRAARMKDEFLSSMSHELRTPLNGILGLSESLEEGIYGPLTPQQLVPLRTVAEAGYHLLELINDILDLSKIEAGRLELHQEAINVDKVCDASLRMIKQPAQQKHLRVSLTMESDLGLVLADERRLKQMLVNLLGNAVKFTPENGQVGLQVSVNDTTDSIRFTVWDTGIGIEPDKLKLLFQPFTQIDSSLSRQYSGTGLGLSLVRQLAELHGGSVGVESEPNKGSRFYFDLPMPQTQPMPNLELGVGEWAIKNALVVDDSITSSDQLMRYMHELGTHVVIEHSGENIVERAAHLQPDVILLDLLMPGRSGWDSMSALKADKRTQSIPVIISSVMDERARGIAAGAVGYLVKPISREALYSALRHIHSTPASIAPGNTEKVAPTSISESARPPTIETASNQTGQVILLAEDNTFNQQAFTDLLTAKGFKVVLAVNGADALERAEECNPALILMDIQMPVMDGLEATRRLREHPQFTQVPIIALTALAMPGDRERCLAAGANDYLTKPVSLKKLLGLIHTLLPHSDMPTSGSTHFD